MTYIMKDMKHHGSRIRQLVYRVKAFFNQPFEVDYEQTAIPGQRSAGAERAAS